MQNILKALLLLCVLVPVLSGCSHKKNSLQKEKLVGRVESITLLTYGAIDSMGRAEKGTLEWQNTFLYDDEGNMVKQINQPVTDNEIAGTISNSYDTKGNVIEQIHYNEFGKETFKSINKFDNKGNIISSEAYDEGIKRTDNSRSEYEYDVNDNIKEIKTYNSKGQYYGKSTYQYDDRGNVIEALDYNEYDHFIYKGITRYDAKNNEIERVGYNADGSVASKSVMEYIFDDKGNWIIKRFYKNGKPDGYHERKIEYY